MPTHYTVRTVNYKHSDYPDPQETTHVPEPVFPTTKTVYGAGNRKVTDLIIVAP